MAILFLSGILLGFVIGILVMCSYNIIKYRDTK